MTEELMNKKKGQHQIDVALILLEMLTARENANKIRELLGF